MNKSVCFFTSANRKIRICKANELSWEWLDCWKFDENEKIAIWQQNSNLEYVSANEFKRWIDRKKEEEFISWIKLEQIEEKQEPFNADQIKNFLNILRDNEISILCHSPFKTTYKEIIRYLNYRHILEYSLASGSTLAIKIDEIIKAKTRNDFSSALSMCKELFSLDTIKKLIYYLRNMILPILIDLLGIKAICDREFLDFEKNEKIRMYIKLVLDNKEEEYFTKIISDSKYLITKRGNPSDLIKNEFENQNAIESILPLIDRRDFQAEYSSFFDRNGIIYKIFNLFDEFIEEKENENKLDDVITYLSNLSTTDLETACKHFINVFKFLAHYSR